MAPLCAWHEGSRDSSGGTRALCVFAVVFSLRHLQGNTGGPTRTGILLAERQLSRGRIEYPRRVQAVLISPDSSSSNPADSLMRCITTNDLRFPADIKSGILPTCQGVGTDKNVPRTHELHLPIDFLACM